MQENSKNYDYRYEEHIVRAYEVDAHGFISLPSLCNLLQSAAANHARDLQLSIHDLTQLNQTWVLSRLAIQIENSPVWGDRIAVETWPSGIRKLFAMRDISFSDPERKVPIASAVTAWVIIDAETRKPMRPEQQLGNLRFGEGNLVLQTLLDKLPPPENVDYERLFRVGFSDMDVNRHVNNSRYIAWVYETVPPEIHFGSRPYYLEINYLGEAIYGDELRSISCHTNNAVPEFRHSVIRVSDNREILRAVTKWNKIE